MTWENRFILEISSADPDSDAPVWVDFTLRVRDNVTPMMVRSGRQNDLEQTEPGVFTATLENADDALSYGNTLSPYPWWGEGRRVRLRETIAGTVMDVFTGFISDLTELLATAGIVQRVQLTAIDRLGRLASAPTFISTLAAYIQYAGGANLVRYWSLLDPAAPFPDAIGGDSPLAALLIQPTGGTGGTAAVTPAGGTTVAADDRAGVKLTVGDAGGGVSASSYALSIGASGIAGGVVPPSGLVAVGGPMILVWINAQLPFDDTVTLITFHLAWGATSGATCTVSRSSSGSGGVIRLDVTGTVTGSISTGLALSTDRSCMIGVRVVPFAGLTTMSLWVDDRVFTDSGTGSGGLVSGLVCDYLTFGGKLQGTLSHAQVYTTALATQQIADQRALALTGLERQPTGDRIRTIAQYAGIPASQLTQIDTGSSVMQRVTLAGKTPLTAMRDAERTEQGLLYVDGSGNLVFKDRRTLYNI